MNVEVHVTELLQKLGIKTGHTVLDFGCGPGTYTIPAARIVGQGGRVYAWDKDKQVLDQLVQNARKAGLQNIRRINSSGILKIDLQEGSIDTILLFDVFHAYYFPRSDQRRKLLDGLYRILKPDGVLLVYPKHMEAEAEDEIKHCNFHLKTRYSGTLIHDQKDFVAGHVLVFQKNRDDDPESAES